ncbi:MAG: ATP-binding protein [Clostridia bacterium]|nr:ATP-binding protein [Oscillospiraceae bacterium]MBQ7115037.1 ATP-binding protein [Clostridia bacterium]
MPEIKNYRKRIADDILKRKLEGKGAVLIEGPKWCGKTTTAEQVASSVLYMDDPEKKSQNIAMAEMNPKRLLKGDSPRLIDEWQLAPKLWDAIRFEVDHRSELGQFILTGSAVPPETKDIAHTGTGRFTWLTMRTMSLFESGDSTGDVSLKELFESPETIDGESTIDLDRLAFLVCRGGWPQAIDMRDEIALDQAIDYYDAVVHSDINRVDNVNKNPERVKRLMRSYARNQGTQVANTVLANDVMANDGASIDDDTIASYVNALKKIFVVEDMPAWNPNLRSKTAIRSSDTRYYTDPSIAAAALGIGPQDLVADLNTFGFLFETMCVRDLRVFADAIGGTVYHYRDKDGLECDAVVHLRNGSYGLIEIKLGGDTLIDDGARTLSTLAQKIDTDKMKAPAFSMVLVGIGDYAYRRPDGVYVVPIGSLRN